MLFSLKKIQQDTAGDAPEEVKDQSSARLPFRKAVPDS